MNFECARAQTPS